MTLITMLACQDETLGVGGLGVNGKKEKVHIWEKCWEKNGGLNKNKK